MRAGPDRVVGACPCAMPGAGGRPHSALPAPGAESHGAPRLGLALPTCEPRAAFHGVRAIPVPQNAKTADPWAVFTHSLAKVRS
jgi:hypothetical protein